MKDAEKLRDWLDGRWLLFVDDEKTTVVDYLLELPHDIHCDVATRLEDAMRLFESKPEQIGFVLLDLDLPRDGSLDNPELKPFFTRLGESARSLNRGRALGLYLWHRRGDLKIRYAYLSGLLHECGEQLGEFAPLAMDKFKLDKTRIYPSELPGHLLKIIELWKTFPEGRS